MAKELEKTYNPAGLEERLYQKWEKTVTFMPSQTAAKSRLRL